MNAWTKCVGAAAAVVLLVGCGTSVAHVGQSTTALTTPTMKLLGAPTSDECRQVADEIDRAAGPATTSTVASAPPDTSLGDYVHQQAMSAWWNELEALAEQHPGCFSVGLRAQVTAAYRRMHPSGVPTSTP